MAKTPLKAPIKYVNILLTSEELSNAPMKVSNGKYVLLLEKALGIKLDKNGSDLKRGLMNMLYSLSQKDDLSFEEIQEEASLVLEYFGMFKQEELAEELDSSMEEKSDIEYATHVSGPVVLGKIDLDDRNQYAARRV